MQLLERRAQDGMSEEKIDFTADDGSQVELYILEETRISGRDYLLVADSPEDESTCYILKDVSEADSPEAVYEMVEDEAELDYLTDIFSELLDETEIERE